MNVNQQLHWKIEITFNAVQPGGVGKQLCIDRKFKHSVWKASSGELNRLKAAGRRQICSLWFEWDNVICHDGSLRSPSLNQTRLPRQPHTHTHTGLQTSEGAVTTAFMRHVGLQGVYHFAASLPHFHVSLKEKQRGVLDIHPGDNDAISITKQGRRLRHETVEARL